MRRPSRATPCDISNASIPDLLREVQTRTGAESIEVKLPPPIPPETADVPPVTRITMHGPSQDPGRKASTKPLASSEDSFGESTQQELGRRPNKNRL